MLYITLTVLITKTQIYLHTYLNYLCILFSVKLFCVKYLLCEGVLLCVLTL